MLLDAATEPLVGSTVTLAEVPVGAVRAARLDQAPAALQRLGASSVGLGDQSFRTLAALRAEARLKLPDCCVLLLAEQAEGDVGTFDAAFAAAARVRGRSVRS